MCCTLEVEQLPLSLHRSFALIGEQDKEVEGKSSILQCILLDTHASFQHAELSFFPPSDRMSNCASRSIQTLLNQIWCEAYTEMSLHLRILWPT